MAETCLELKKIKKSFSKDETVLKEISLSIGKGEFITLLRALRHRIPVRYFWTAKM